MLGNPQFSRVSWWWILEADTRSSFKRRWVAYHLLDVKWWWMPQQGWPQRRNCWAFVSAVINGAFHGGVPPNLWCLFRENATRMGWFGVTPVTPVLGNPQMDNDPVLGNLQMDNDPVLGNLQMDNNLQMDSENTRNGGWIFRPDDIRTESTEDPRRHWVTSSVDVGQLVPRSDFEPGLTRKDFQGGYNKSRHTIYVYLFVCI